jgi:hypothetical protein
MSSPGRKGRRGGPGTAGGVDFQAKLAAALACDVLAEADATPLWGWSEHATLESIHLETGEAVDDLRAVTSLGANAYIQAKLSLRLSAATDSELAKALESFVEQYLTDGKPDPGFSNTDLLVLAVGPPASKQIRERLPFVLERVIGLPADEAIERLDFATGDKEVLETVTAHVSRAWRAQTGTEPSEDELRALLGVIRVSVHDLENDGSEAKIARGLLRTSVLAKSSEAGSAWDSLIATTVGFSKAQSGGNRERLQQLLSAKGFALKAPPSYRDDIGRLRKQTEATAARLAPLSNIRLGGSELRIRRDRLTEAIAAASAGPLLITGEPGTGKSAEVFGLLAGALEKGTDVLALSADALASASLGELRTELGLEHDLVEVLRNWPGEGGALLVVDGLDAARGEGTQEALLDLIAAVQVGALRWNVTASVRRFDLRYNGKLRDLFTAVDEVAVSPEFTAAEFSSLRHIVVPALADDELDQLAQLAPPLHELLEAAPEDLRDLARIPFNLRLLAELIELDVDRAELEPISTQVQLLDKYWEHRVIGFDGEGDARAAVVRDMVQRMVSEQRLQVSRADVANAVASPALAELLSGNVITEVETSSGLVEHEILAFSHHVLFDYAVDRSMLRGTEDRLAAALSADPDLILFARPSFDLHYRYLWEIDDSHSRFWETCLVTAATSGVPGIARIIAPAVAAELLGVAADAEPLLLALRADGTERRASAEQMLRHLVGAAVGSNPSATTRSGQARAAWTGLAPELARQDLNSRVIAFSLNQLIAELSKNASALGEAEVAALGQASRALLGHALDQEHSERAFTWNGISAVVATYSSDPVASRKLLARILEPERMKRFAFHEVPDLAMEIEKLIDADPEFAAEVYRATFAFEETSKEETEMGTVILPLRSHRSQDYAAAGYSLSRAYPEFLAKAPEQALDALIAVRAAYGRRRFEHSSGGSKNLPWNGSREILVLDDGSSVWDREPLGHDDEVKILDAFEAHLDTLALEDREAIDTTIDTLAAREVPASIWRRVVLLAARHPEVIGARIEPLLRSGLALAHPIFSEPLGDYLKVAFSELDQELRDSIETAIMAIPAEFCERAEAGQEDVAARRGELARDRLLGCLQITELSNAEACKRLDEMVAAREVPDNTEPGIISEWGSSEFTERDHLRELGVDVDAKVNAELYDLSCPIHEFASKYLNERAPAKEACEIVTTLEQLWEAIRDTEKKGEADEHQLMSAIGRAAECADALARSEIEDCAHPALALAQKILLAAAEHESPRYDPDRDEQFDKHPSWGSPAPRVEAAQGLVYLAAKQGCPERDKVLATIETLSQDAAPEVRHQVARRLGRLARADQGMADQIAERIASTDPSRAVKSAMLAALPALTADDIDKRREVAEALFASNSTGAGSEDLRDRALSLLNGLYVGRGDEKAGEFLRGALLEAVTEDHRLVHTAIVRQREAMSWGGDAGREAEIRARAIGLVEEVLNRALERYTEIEQSLRKRGERPAEDDPELQRGRAAAQTVDTVATEVYFASGSYVRQGEDESQLSPERRRRFYGEAGNLLDSLTAVMVPSATHHLLETLEACVEFDPRGVFVRIARAISSGRMGGYQTDPMAEKLFVSLAERYLAEYRTLLQGDADLRRLLVEMLDIFVEAGWPRARQLTYGLHEIFR